MIPIHRHLQLHILIDKLESTIRCRTTLLREVDNLKKSTTLDTDIRLKRLKSALRKARRRINELPLCPKDINKCKYRVSVSSDVRQRNALRIELLPSDDFRCGASLKTGRLGGSWIDYHICTG